MFTSFYRNLFKRIDISSLVFFRIAFGAIMLWEVIRYFNYDWIRRFFIEPTFHFKFLGFEWIEPWAGNCMYLHFYLLGLLSIFIMLGFYYRVSTILFFLGLSYVFLLEQATYLNHFYLICLISFLLIFVPAHKNFSLDSYKKSFIKSKTAPAWALWLLRIQIGIVYFYGGIAKLNSDWLAGEPMRMWLPNSGYSFFGNFFPEEWLPYLFSYGGLLFDLLIVPLLLYKKTRIYAFIIAAFFHITNAWMFSIGIFPLFALAATTLFFEPDWPNRLSKKIIAYFTVEKNMQVNSGKNISEIFSERKHTFAVLFFCTYILFQLLFPLRHILYPGNVNWTEEGHRFSWQMKLRDKNSYTSFFVVDLNNDKREEINLNQYLKKWQIKPMSGRPDMIVQFAHYLGDQMNKKGYKNIAVNAVVLTSLNGRKPQYLINPYFNLLKQSSTLFPMHCIMPFPLSYAEMDGN